MKKLLDKILVFIALLIAGLMPVYSADIFSHTVLLMPNDLDNEKPWVKVIKNQQEWEAYFYATTAAVSYPIGKAPVAPKLDFNHYQVIAGGLGLRFSGGYSLSIDSVHTSEDAMTIHLLDIRPGVRCLVTMGLTQPTITIMVKKTDNPIHYIVSEVIFPCAE